MTLRTLYEKKGKIFNTALLLIEAPFFPILYPFFSYMVRKPQGRKILYLQTRHFFPLRRLSFYILDKLFEKECGHYSRPSYDGLSGYILDLKYALAHTYFNNQIFDNNYKYSFARVREIVEENKNRRYALIDFGCGAGVMTRLLKKTFRGASVYGLDIRDEIMEYNTLMYKDITWGNVSTLGSIAKNPEVTTILLCNGVVNFMTRQELDTLLAHRIPYIVWFYYVSSNDLERYYAQEQDVLSEKHNDVDYNLPRILKKNGYQFEYTVARSNSLGGVFVCGVSTLVA